MKINIDQNVINYDGDPIEVKAAIFDKDGNETEPAKFLTFRTVIENALGVQDEQHKLTAEKKLFAFQIGVKLFSKKIAEYDLTVDQVAFLRERIGLFYGPVPYGRFLELIGDQSISEEAPTEPTAKKKK